MSFIQLNRVSKFRLPKRNWLGAFSAAAVIGLVWPVASPAGAPELLPHRVLYKMSLASASSGSGISDIKGAMMYQFQESCDSWASETNVYLRLLYDEGDEIETTWSFVSWESKDGRKYRFRVRHNRNGAPIEVLQGHIQRDEPGGAGRVEFVSPKGTNISIPTGTMFPTRHLLAMLAEQDSGKKFFSKTVFDGASLDNPYRINAHLTAKTRADGDLSSRSVLARKGAEGSGNERRRSVRMAFFPVNSRDPIPEFELGIDYRDDGVAEYIHQDFGDYSLDLVPSEFEAFERPEC